MIKLQEMRISPDGRRVDYDYTTSARAARFFRGAERYYVEYPVDVSSCPKSILAIPFVSNFEPIGWFMGCEVNVPDLDAEFMRSRLAYRQCFSDMFPGNKLHASIGAERLTENIISGDEILLLYSGGMDAATTLARNFAKKMTLVLMRGADIDVADSIKWTELSTHVRTQQLTQGRRILSVTSNFRKFYNARVDARLLNGWWGRVQHGGALLGTLAPLGYVLGARTNIISSSYDVPMAWGSTKTADELLRWAGASCIHDAADMSRQQKAKFLAGWRRDSGIDVKLRVCYSELNRNGNCGECEKCYRTILNLVLCGADPRSFGLPMDGGTYEKMMNYMRKRESSVGLVKFWKEISNEARHALLHRSHFVLVDSAKEGAFIKRIADGEIDSFLARNLSAHRRLWSLIKYKIRVELPRLYSALRLAREGLSRARIQ